MRWPFKKTKTSSVAHEHEPLSDFMFRDLEYRDPLQLPRVELSELERSDNCVWVEREAGPYPVPFRPPAFHDRVTPDGLADMSVGLPPLGPAAFVMALSDVLLVGSRGLIGRDGRYCFDESYPSSDLQRSGISMLGAPEIHLNQWMGFVGGEGGPYQLQTEKPVIQIDEPIVLLTSSEGPNFGAFIFRMLPKIAAVARLDKNLKILAPTYFDTFRQFLVAAGIESNRIIPHFLVDRWYRLKRVYVPSIRNRDVWLDAETMQLYDHMRMVHGGPRGRRKSISRGKALGGTRDE